MIRMEGLTKFYGDVPAVQDLSLTVGKGEIFGFLGPNGSGKTTTIRMLMGILIPSSGRAWITDRDCHRERPAIMRETGYLPDVPIFYDYLKGREMVQFAARLHGMGPAEASERTQTLLLQMNLTEASEEFVTNYSFGMKKKIGLACALVHDPSILIMDEPTAGLDPHATREIHALIKSFASQGKTIFLSTHLLEHAQKLCHRVGIIHRGRLVTIGTLEELRTRATADASLEEMFFAVTEGTAPVPPS